MLRTALHVKTSSTNPHTILLYPGKLANDFLQAVGQFGIDQLLGENSEYFRFTSLTNYYQ